MSRKKIALYSVIAIVPLIAALWIAGFDPNYELGNYVTTDNARVTGNLVQASAPSAGQVMSIVTNVGDPVQSGQMIASLRSVGSSSTTGAPARPFLPEVRAPSNGTIVHVSVIPGQAVTAGQSIATIANLNSLWVIAGIDEGSFKAVHPGQRAEVYLTALDHTFPGTVSQLMPDVAAANGVSTSGTVSGSSAVSGPTQMPLAITFNYQGYTVYPGMSASVRIFVH